MQSREGSSYAQVLQQRPSRILTPKDVNLTVQDIRTVLNKEINTTTLTNISCKSTKAGNLVVTCNNEKDIKELQQQLEGNSKLTPKIAVEQIKP